MKNSLQRAGVIGLAAATIITGLSFGPAAATAVEQPASVQAGRTSTHLIAQSGGTWWYDAPDTKSASTRAEAEAEATTYDVVWYNETDFQLKTDSNTCLYFSTTDYLGVVGNGGTGTCAEKNAWRIGSDGRVTLANDPSTYINGVGNAWSSDWFLFGRSGTPLQFAELRSMQFRAQVDSVDAVDKTAQVSGWAVPNSSVMINGTDQFLADSKGVWSGTVSGLKLGSNPLHLTQWENGVQTGEYTLDAEIKVSPITATTAFGADLTDEAIVKGAAQPGATIIVRDAAGTEIGRTTASTNDDGAWELEIPAPNAPGDYAVTAQQLIDGDDGGTATATIAYGAAVKIDSPIDGIAFDGGNLTMTGTGEIDADIRIREKGTEFPILAYGNVFQNGQWNLTTTKLDDGEHVLEVTQTGKGNNTTVSTVTLNPGAGEIAPVAVTNPADPKAGYVPNTGFTFEGTGTKGKTIQVENKFGTPLGTTTVRPNNTWSWTRANMGTSIWTINFIQDKGTVTEAKAQVANFAPTAETPTPAPVAVTNPADPTTGYVPHTGFTFEGTGTKGKTIQVENKFGTPLGTTRVENDNTWSWTRANMGTSTWTINFIQDKGETTQSTATVLNFKPSTDTPAPAPLVEVTNPADPKAGYVPNTGFTFEGTGTKGKTIQVENKFGTTLGTTTVRPNNTWSWTRANMGTSIWTINFIQDKGTATEAKAQVAAFAPRR